MDTFNNSDDQTVRIECETGFDFEIDRDKNKIKWKQGEYYKLALWWHELLTLLLLVLLMSNNNDLFGMTEGMRK